MNPGDLGCDINMSDDANQSSNSSPSNPVHDDQVDARPSEPSLTDTDAKPAEVDARPIVRPPGAETKEPLVIPTQKDSPHYVLEGVKQVIIFNQKKFAQRLGLGERKGTEVDVKSIQTTFKTLDWSVDLYNDLTVAEIRKVILEQIQLSEREISALAIFILSHGEDNGTIFASDYPFRVDHDILFPLAADKSPGLAGKPKLIFVQACQGQETDPGSSVDGRRRRHTSTDSTATYKIPNYVDFMVFQASFWDHYSFRSPETGSWFIQSLCSAIDSSGNNESLMDILMEVSRHVALNKESNVPGKAHLDKKKQIPLLYSTMIRKLYLKHKMDDNSSVKSSGDVQLVNSVADMKLTKPTNDHGSQKSLFKDKIKKDDCSCM